MKDFLLAQKKKIEIDKWCEGCNLTRDPGQDYIISWIDHHGAWFRDAWEKSLCCSCNHNYKCGHKVLQVCSVYKKSSSAK